jgi:antitoxin component YwqK of YwqJK toxin-antitoxin module
MPLSAFRIMRNKRSLFLILLFMLCLKAYAVDSTVVVIKSKKQFYHYYSELKVQYLSETRYGIALSLTGKIVGVNKKGITRFRINVVNGLFHGKQEYFFPGGEIWEAFNCDSGRYEGAYITYYTNGMISMKSNYVKGAANGWQDSYYEDGLIRSRYYYEKGQMFNCVETIGGMDMNVVQEFRDSVHLKLTVDSMRLNGKIIKIPVKFTLDLEYESELLKLNDSLYIKLILIRNHEYGQKFYSLRIDPFKKKADCYLYMQGSGVQLVKVPYNKESTADFGIGNRDDLLDYMQFYFRYHIE